MDKVGPLDFDHRALWETELSPLVRALHKRCAELGLPHQMFFLLRYEDGGPGEAPIAALGSASSFTEYPSRDWAIRLMDDLLAAESLDQFGELIADALVHVSPALRAMMRRLARHELIRLGEVQPVETEKPGPDDEAPASSDGHPVH